MKESKIDLPLLYSSDPLACFLIKNIHLKPLKICLVVLTFELVFDIIFSAYLGILSANKMGVTGFFETWTFPFFSFLVVPITWAFYLWISEAPKRLFDELRATEVVSVSKSEYDKEIERYIGFLYNNKLWVVASIIVAVCAGIAVQKTNAFGRVWNSANPYLYWIKTAQNYLGLYAVCMIVIKELSTIIVLRNLFRKFPVNLHPLHPDKCGGLNALSRYSIRFTYFIGIAGLGVSMVAYDTIRSGSFYNAYIIQFAIAAYVFLSVYTFFAPLGAAHKAMKDAKEKWLMDISQHFQQAYESTTKVLNSPVTKLKSNVQKIEQLQEIYDLTEKFPVWPFDTKSLQRFGATLLTSISPLIVSLLKKMFGFG